MSLQTRLTALAQAIGADVGELQAALAAASRTGEIVNAAVQPSATLLCDGSAVSRTTYANLFARIGTTFGAGDGSTTFNVPDRRNVMWRTWVTGSGAGGALTEAVPGNDFYIYI